MCLIDCISQKVLLNIHCSTHDVDVCEADTVVKISDCQLESPGFNRRHSRGLNFGELLSPHCPWTGTLSFWSSLSTLYRGTLKTP